MTTTMTVDTGDPELDSEIKLWLSRDKNISTRQEVIALLENNNVEELGKRFGKRLAFGTAGLRAVMGAGIACMNDLVVIQTAQGLLKYLLKVNPECKSRGIVIGYDARHNSRRYADLTAAIFVREGVPVLLFSDIVPTPFVAYAISKKGLSAGVMVTPSHNPCGDNGYKVYWGNGAQIIPPIDKGIAQSILDNLDPWEKSWDTTLLDTSTLVSDPYQEILDSYLDNIYKLCRYRSINEQTSLKFTFTAMHGVGTRFFQELFHRFGFSDLVLVKEQVEPNPDFPTVKNPNPEEGKNALDLSFKTAEANNSTIILANDPDADRLAVVEKQEGDTWKIFTGNELGLLFGWWCLDCFRSKQKDGNGEILGEDVYMLASTVSSKVLQTMSRIEGFQFIETLTGFKWMGNKIYELLKAGKTPIFAFEEAIGFACSTKVLDKDGVSAGVLLCEMAAFLHSQGKSLNQQLDELYKKYGYHYCFNSYYICRDPLKTQAIFERIRKHTKNSYPTHIGSVKVTSIRDLTTGYDSSQPDNKAILPTSKSSHMITFTFDNGSVATLRTSGTEPKIKYYSEIQGDLTKSDKTSIQNKLVAFMKEFVEDLLQPEHNKLIPKGE